MSEAVEATRESEREEKSGNEAELVRLWLDALNLADREEEPWRKRAEDTVQIYRQHDANSMSEGESIKKGERKFNILHANVETLLPALYNSTPIPDVRRRYDDANPTAKTVVDILERGIAYSVDGYDFDETMRFATSDMELTGRGVSRVRYLPYVKDDELAYEEVVCEHVPWKNFRRGPGRCWPDVPWVAFELFLTRDELVKLSPEHGNAVNLDATMAGADDKRDGSNPPEVFKRAQVWEIWDKNGGEVLFIAPSFKEKPIRREQDPLGLQAFFPTPRPLYAIATSDSLVPVVPYEIYRDQAEELERVSQRIMALTEACKARGVYDSRADEVAKLADADDNEMVPITNVAVFADGADLKAKILYWPLETIIRALEQLYLAREQIKATIYEITGIADILRGNTNPNETLGAQELKAQWGSLRIQRKQAEIARYARDLFRLKAEIIATKFDQNTIQMMTGIPLVPQQGEPPEAAMQKQAALQMLRSDTARGFNVDVESDSTIRADLTRKQQNMNLFLQGTAQFAAAMGPIVMAPQFQALAPAVVEIYAAFARNFKLGKQAEDALDDVADQARRQAENPPPEKPDPAIELEKFKAQNEAQKMQAQADADQVKMAAELEFKRQEQAMKLEAMSADLQKKQMELQMKERELEMKAQEMQMGAHFRAQEMAMDAEAHETETAMDLRAHQQQMALDAEAGEHKHRLSIEAMEAKLEAQRRQAKMKPKNGARR